MGYNGSEDHCLLKTRVRHFHLLHSYLPWTHAFTFHSHHKNMKELAEQELKILEAQHPTRFQHLKLELKEFIHLFDEEEEQQSPNRKQQQQFHLSILTQESSSRKRERVKGERKEGKRRRTEGGISSAIKKAEACLHKIEILKSLFCPTNG